MCRRTAAIRDASLRISPKHTFRARAVGNVLGIATCKHDHGVMYHDQTNRSKALARAARRVRSSATCWLLTEQMLAQVKPGISLATYNPQDFSNLITVAILLLQARAHHGAARLGAAPGLKLAAVDAVGASAAALAATAAECQQAANCGS